MRVRWPRLFAALALAVGLVAYLFAATSLAREVIWMAGILVLAAGLWMSEALPLFATSLLVIFLEMLLLANPGRWVGLGFAGPGTGPAATFFLHAAVDGTVLLFFGGLTLGTAINATGADAWLSARLLRPFGQSPGGLLAGVLLVTALFSMWMSNTATAAMMLALVAPLRARLPPDDSARRGLVLAVAVGANLGGLGTPIASPPNAIALGVLRQEGIRVGFAEWMLVAVPLLLVLLALAWVVLWKLLPPRACALPPDQSPVVLSRAGRVALLILGLTVLLWLTEGWHGLTGGMVALGAVLALILSGVCGADDLRRLDWPVLILIGGGLALGAGLQTTGLDRELIAALPLPDRPGLWLQLTFVLATLLLSTFVSNTAAASLVLPMAVAAVAARAAGEAAAPETATLVLAVALTASLAMSLPVSTPPNALASSGGDLRAGELGRTGLILGITGAALVPLALWLLLR